MNLLLENYWPWILFGILGEAIVAVALLRTGRGVLLWAMAGVLAVSLLGMAVVKWVPTERKAVAATIYDTAKALEANDLDRVLKHVLLSDEHTRADADNYMSMFEFVEVKVSFLEITINYLTSPPTAKATFNVKATGRERGASSQWSQPAKLTVQLLRQPNGWMISDHVLSLDPR